MCMKSYKKIVITMVLSMLGFTFQPFFMGNVQAANFDFVAVRPDRMAISVSSPHLILINPATTGTEDTTKITFPSGYTVTSASATNTGVPTTYHGISVSTSTIAGTAVSGQEVTVDHGDLVVGTLYGFYINSVTNPSSIGQKSFTVTTQTSAPATIDSSTVAVYVVTDNGSGTDDDQIVVTASVSPTFTLDLNTNSDSVTTSLGSVTSGTGVTATVTTNAQNGYSVWFKSGTSSGLTSATTGTSIAFSGTAADGSDTLLSAGTEGVVVDADSTTNTSGALTIAGEFNGSSTSRGGTPSTTYQQIFSSTAPVGGVGDVATIIPRVAISATTKAATDYTQTFTVTGAGSF